MIANANCIERQGTCAYDKNMFIHRKYGYEFFIFLHAAEASIRMTIVKIHSRALAVHTYVDCKYRFLNNVLLPFGLIILLTALLLPCLLALSA